jgi:predicted amino acid dehydrogenase
VSKKVTVLHYFNTHLTESEIITLLGQPVEIEHIHCQGDLDQMKAHIELLDGQVDAIALNGVTQNLRLGNRSVEHLLATPLFEGVHETPILDGSVLLPAIERWSVRMAHGKEPGIWAHKRVLMVPGLNHTGLSEGLEHHAASIKSADRLLYPNLDPPVSKGLLPDRRSAQQDDWELLNQLKAVPFETLFSSNHTFDEASKQANDAIFKLFDWADILAGDIESICHFSPSYLQRKIVAVPAITDEQVATLTNRGVSIIVTLLPNLSYDKHKLARHSAATLEACLTAVSESELALGENDFLNLISEIEWQPSIQYLQPADVAVNRFGFITQPRSIAEIRANITAARFLPKAFIHRTAVHIPPVFRGRMENIKAKGSRKSAVGEIMMLGGTPEEFAAQDAELIARRMLRAASMAERLEARLIGVDTASREVSDALSAIAPKTNVPICTGQAMTIYGTLASGVEIATKNSVRSSNKAVGLQGTVINANDPIGAIAAEVLASFIPIITLIGSEPDLLIELKRKIEDIHINTKVTIATNANHTIRHSDLIVLGRNMAGKRMIFNPEICNPGAVICDFSQPTVITPELLAQRPDLTLVESTVFRLPEPSMGEACGNLPHDLVTAPFAEAALLAIRGNFVDYGLVGELSSKHVYDIRDLALKSNYIRAGILAHGEMVASAQIECRRELAERYAQQIIESGGSEQKGEVVFTEQPARPSIRRFAREHSTVVVTGVGVFAVIAGVLGWFFRKKKNL